MIFQIPKNLLLDALNTISPVMAKSTNPQEFSQYLVIKTEGKKLTLILSGQEYTGKVVIDERAEAQDLKIETNGTYIVQADVMLALLSRSDVRDKVSVDFEQSKGEVIKTDDPNTTIPVLGNLVLKFPPKQVWTMPCIDTKIIDVPTDPSYETGGKNKLVVDAAEFLKILSQVGMAVGEDGGDPKLRNVLLRTTQDSYELVTTTSIHLAWSKMTPKHSSGSYSFTVPHRCMLIGARCAEMNYEGDIEVVHNQGGADTVVMTRDLLCGDKPVGKVFFRTSCATEGFAKFEALLNKLNFTHVCKFKTQQLKPKLGMLGIMKSPRVNIVIDSKTNMMTFSKKENGRLTGSGVETPITIIQGGDFDIEISDRHLASSVMNAEEDEIEWSFSGKTTLCKMKLSGDLTAYFAPFTE